LGPGDRLLLYTDGISEAVNRAGVLFGEERLCRLVESMPLDLPSRVVSERILEDLRRHAGTSDQADDMTLLGLQVRSPARGLGGIRIVRNLSTATTQPMKSRRVAFDPARHLLAPAQIVVSTETQLRYSVERWLGEGGFGQVYLARRLGRSSTVAET